MAAEEGAPRFLVTPRDEDSQRLIGALQKLYRQKLRPVEEAFSFGRFHYDAITDTELEAKSQVLVIGQYSTGKTTFIRHLLGADFPNMNIGPEPTTDKFTVVIHGEEDRPVEGNSLAVIKELPYEGLTRFGTGFLNKLDAAISTSPFLENITLVDTPGVLSGEMQMHQRDYNFADVARWFADRSDMILILFDAHRLDVSDELMEILMRLKDHQGIIRIVLNKADQVDRAKLRRVYGALMWSMGKVFDNPEVVRVYVGSFWEKPLRHTAHQQLFKTDQDTLTRELTDLPRLSAIRKINQLIKRTNIVRAHACVLSYLNEQTPWMFGRDRRREDLLKNLKGVLETVRARHGLHAADMPDVDVLRANLQSFDFASFPTLTRATLRQLNDVVDVDIHKVLKEGGGSEKIFKFSRNRSPPPRPGLLSRAGSSVFNLLGVGGATPSAPPPIVGTRVTSPVSGVGTSRGVERSTASEGTSAQQARRSDAGRGEEGSSRGGVETGRDLERNKRGAPRWTCRSVLQVLLLVFITLAFLLLALGSVGVTSDGPLHYTKQVMTNQATRLLSPKRAIGAVRRLVGSTVEREGEPGEGTGDSIPEEVEALYRGTVH